MKATKTSREAADYVDVRRNGEGGTTYKCLKCGFTTESNTYNEVDYKTMLKHAAECDRQGIEADTQLTILPVQQQGARAIQLYDSEMIERLAGRIKRCVPNGDRLSNNEALALAQIAISTDLSPFVGELYYIPGKGPGVGIEGLRRKASEQSTYSMAPPRAMTGEEITEHDLKEYDVGRVAELYRHDILAKAVEINKAAGEAIIPIQPIVGIGIWKKGDQVPKGKSPAWVASKRAEADALKKGFNIVIPLHENGEWLPVIEEEEVVDAEVVRREVAINNGERVAQVSAVLPQDFSDVVAKYQGDEPETPHWIKELREAIREHPKASDALSSGDGMIQQLKLSAERMVKAEQFKAAVEIICKHPLEEVTFGEAAILMNKFVNGPDFEAKVVALFS